MNLPTFASPPGGPIQGKVWGKTQLLFVHNSVECHLIQFKKGGYSSIHSHHHKWNRFVVLKGELEIEVFQAGDLIDSTVLSSGQESDVAPGDLHRFRALTDGQALEIYWTTLDAQDIERGDSQGGMEE